MYWYTSIVKMENDEFENVRIENCTSYYFDVIIKLEDFDIDSILILIALKDEKSNEKYYMVLKNMMPVTKELDVL